MRLRLYQLVSVAFISSFQLIAPAKSTDPVSMSTLFTIFNAAKWTYDQYQAGLHCSAICTPYACGLGAAKNRNDDVDAVTEELSEVFKNKSDYRATANMTKRERSLGSLCKKTCQWKETFDLGGNTYELKKRFDTRNGWNIEGCVRAYNKEVEDRTGTRQAMMTSLAVYNQREYDKIKNALKSYNKAPTEKKEKYLETLVNYFQKTIDVQ